MTTPHRSDPDGLAQKRGGCRVSGWGAGYPGVPSDVAKKARETKAAQAAGALGANAEAAAGDAERKNEESATGSPDDPSA
jgi:hypothetical protein